MNEPETGDRSIPRTSWKLALAVPVMFAFVFVVMVPLYNTICQVTGLNGKPAGEAYKADPASTVIDKDRWVEVRFVATDHEGMSWEFRPDQAVMKVHPGQENATTFFARNPTAADMVAQAVPSIVPSSAAAHFHKTECFCFRQQKLAAGATAEMPLRFIVDRDLPPAIEVVTLSYTLFDVTPTTAGAQPVVARN